MKIRILLPLGIALSALGLLLAPLARAQGSADCPIPNTYRVQPGDALSAIAERFGTDVATLVELNHLANPDQIYVGQVLYLPCPVRPEDEVASAFFVGAATGAALPSVSPSTPHLTLWNAHREAWRRWRTLLPNADLIWYPQEVKPGDTLIVQVQSDANTPITLSLRILDAWVPLVPTRDGYEGFVPLHGLVMPGLLRVTLGVNMTGTVTHTLDLPVWVEDGNFPFQKIVLPPSKGDLLAPSVIQNEVTRLTEVWTLSEGPPHWQGPFSWPVDVEQWPTTAPYGVRRVYNGGAMRGYHTGQDIAAPEGTPVRAPAAGIVLLADRLDVRGNAVVIDHGAGVTSNYWHLSEITVEAGQSVERGDVIGKVGTTGLSTGAHLHWEIRVYGIPVNPIPWTQSPGPATFWKGEREHPSH